MGPKKLQLSKVTSAIVFGHADADGHLATEQSRTNLQALGIDVKNLVITPETRNYRFWERTFANWNFKCGQMVITVDIAFSFQDPLRSLETVLTTVDSNQTTQFVVIDHHPLMQPKAPRPNLTLLEADSVYQCCFGPPTDELMVVAAICDGDEKSVLSRISPKFEKRAKGVRRAAADTQGLAGTKLLRLLRHRQWKFFEALAEEPSEFHVTARGRRRGSLPNSPMLEAAKAGF